MRFILSVKMHFMFDEYYFDEKSQLIRPECFFMIWQNKCGFCLTIKRSTLNSQLSTLSAKGRFANALDADGFRIE